MKVIHIDDEIESKIKPLAQKIETHPIIDKKNLEEFLKTAAQNPSVAVVDVVSYCDLIKEQMIEIGESLADSGWQVIYWSVGVAADDVREDCWFEDRNNKDGVGAIATAINNREFQNTLKRGSKPSEDELVLSLLSLLLPVGLFWELEANASRDGLLKCIETPKLKGTTEFEQLILTRFKEQVLGKGEEIWSIPRVFRNLVKRLDKFIENQWNKIPDRSAPSNGQDPLSGIERALAVMASSENLQQWNENLIILREALLNNKMHQVQNSQ